MQTSVSRNESRATGNQGIVYRTVCQNPGCGFKFDLSITPENASFSAVQWHVRTANGMAANSNPKGASAKSFSPPSCCSARSGLGRRAATMTKRERTPGINLGKRIGYSRQGLARPSGGTNILSIGFGCLPDMELIRHSDQFSERFGFHLGHHMGPLGLDGPFSSAELRASLFVE